MRRNRTIAAVLTLGLAVAVVSWATSGPSNTYQKKHASSSSQKSHRQPPAPIPLVAVELPAWKLATPLSRMVVEPASDSVLTVLGGYNGEVSEAGVYALDTASGRTSLVGNLAVPTHDAAGAVVEGKDMLFGGGETVTDAVVQALQPGADRPTASTIGQLPGPRSDCVATSIGSVAYVIGGYDGSTGDPTVLATSDGVAFRSVATLPVSVRYPAVSTLGGKIYVFGGEAVGGPNNGQPVSDIQMIDPKTGSAHVLGAMPQALEGASAMNISGQIYLAGGDTASGGGTRARATSSRTVWAFDELTAKMLKVGNLRVPVSNAGIAVTGSTGWLVGGEADGVPVASVQMLLLEPQPTD